MIPHKHLDDSQPQVVGLFSGCGGFDLGFLKSGYKCIAAYDVDPVALENHRQNTGTPTHVRDLSSGDLPEGLPQQVDVLVAGPPCQGFSTIGTRRLDDPRNKLLLSAGRIALALRPRVFVAENVAGALAGAHRKFWDAMCDMLRNGGYRTMHKVIQCVEYGVPQLRKRVLLIAWREDREVRLDLTRIVSGTLRDALSNIDGLPNHEPVPMPVGSLGLRVAPYIGPGQKLCNVRAGERSIPTWAIPEVYGSTTESQRELLHALRKERRCNRIRDFGDADPVSAAILEKSVGRSVFPDLEILIERGYVRQVGEYYDLTHTFNGKYRRLQWTSPSPTVDTKFGDPRFFLHPEEDRGFTVREAARIQGFPDSYTFQGSRRQQYSMVGNAVPPPVAEVLAQWILTALLK